MTLEWEDNPDDGREKYPAMLREVRKRQADNPGRRKEWAVLATFDGEQAGRDLAYRLGKAHPDFDFISRKRDEGTKVLARLKQEDE